MKNVSYGYQKFFCFGFQKLEFCLFNFSKKQSHFPKISTNIWFLDVSSGIITKYLFLGVRSRRDNSGSLFLIYHPNFFFCVRSGNITQYFFFALVPEISLNICFWALVPQSLPGGNSGLNFWAFIPDISPNIFFGR